ncbi:hypothetical protein GQ674_20960 [Stenotrophomonas sp. 364]|nr:hypothetical protein GQ674_20960 [Stenotrophomonas sp. 364]
MSIKSVMRDDLLASLRIPRSRWEWVPQNAGGFRSIRDAYAAQGETELAALQARMLPVNDCVGDDVIQLAPFDPKTLGGIA